MTTMFGWSALSAWLARRVSPETWQRLAPLRHGVLWAGWLLLLIAMILPGESGMLGWQMVAWSTWVAVVTLLLPWLAFYTPSLFLLILVPVATGLILAMPSLAYQCSPKVRWVGPLLILAGLTGWGLVSLPAFHDWLGWVSALWLSSMLVTGAGGMLVAMTVRRPGWWRQCPNCQFDLIGTLSADRTQCPECGRPIDPAAVDWHRRTVKNLGREEFERRFGG